MTTIATGRSLAWATTVFGLLAGSALAAPPDKKPPTTPTDLRVTAVGPYSVSLAWNPSTDNSGSFRYVICCADVSSQTVNAPASSVVYKAGIFAARSYSLRIQAVDAAGNWSRPSNTVSFTTLRDTTPPTTPVVSVTGTGPTHVGLLWSSVDEGPVWFDVRRDGATVTFATRDTAGIVPLLEPNTTYTFTVRARDFPNNLSPVSEPVTVTTPAPDPDDVTAPTTPVLSGGAVGSDCEVNLRWTESTDDFDPQFVIEYEVYVNGVVDHSTALRFTRTTVYGNRNGLNTFAVAAVDSAGNRSALSNEVSETFERCVF